MKTRQLQICILALVAVVWTSAEGAHTLQENGGHLIKESENSIFPQSMPENVRVKRQDDSTSTTPKPKKPRPYNIFKLVSVLATETKDETKKAFSEIGALINSQFANSTTPGSPASGQNNSTEATESQNEDNEIATTEPPRITREEFMTMLRNNLQGIVRLFRKEMKIALEDSSKNAKEFGRDLGLSFRPLIYGKRN